MLRPWRAFCMWLVWNVPLGRLAPHVMHMAAGGGKMRKAA